MYADFIAGWVAGGAGLLVGHPLDTVKARLQTMNAYNGIIDCMAKTMKQESVFGLYKGMWIPFLTTGALHSLLFSGYGAALRILHPGESNIEARKDLPMSEILIASIFATMVQVGPVIPVELIKTKLQVQREKVSHFSNHSPTLYAGPLDCVRQTLVAEGVSGLFKGGSVLFLRDNIGYLFYIPVYEGILRYLTRRNVNETAAQIFAGGCAGVSGWISVCPLEVVKNRIQTNKSSRKMYILEFYKLYLYLHTPRCILFRNAKEVAIEIWRNEGASAFYRGGLALSIRGFVVNAVIFVVYENILSLLDRNTTKITITSC